MSEKKIDAELEKGQAMVPAPPGRKKPKMNPDGKKEPPSVKGADGVTILQVPTSAGQELIDDIPGVPGLKIPGETQNGTDSKVKDESKDESKGESESDDEEEEEDEDKDKDGGQKAQPPPAQEGQPGDSELSVGESGDEGPAPEQDDETEPEGKPIHPPQPKKIKPKKKKVKKPATTNTSPSSPGQKTPQFPPEVKNPPLPKQPVLPPPKPSQKFFGKYAAKKHQLEKNKAQPFSITFAGKHVMNVDKASANFNKVKPAAQLNSEKASEKVKEVAAKEEEEGMSFHLYAKMKNACWVLVNN